MWIQNSEKYLQIKLKITKRLSTMRSGSIHPRDAEMVNTCESLSTTQHFNRLMDTNHMIISLDAGKAFDKIQQHTFMVKVLERIWVEGKRLGTEKAIFREATTNIIVNRKTQSIYSNIRNRTRMSTVSLLLTLCPNAWST